MIVQVHPANPGQDGYRHAEARGDVVEDVGAGAQGEQEDVQRAGDDQGEAGLVVGEVDQARGGLLRVAAHKGGRWVGS